MNDNTSLVILDENLIKDLICDVRGQKVMLDFDLARIYGYSTKALNQQVKNNLDKFANDFMFPLSQNEWDEILKSKILTSSLSKREDSRDAILMSKKTTSSWGGRRILPRAFTEQGIYMLMTVLRGDLAIGKARR